jgi:hypothetical protein
MSEVIELTTIRCPKCTRPAGSLTYDPRGHSTSIQARCPSAECEYEWEITIPGTLVRITFGG